MYCPRCGQQQISEQVKFCSRCGFLLELIPDILANGGTLPQLMELINKKKFLTRKNVIKFGIIWMIFMWFIVTPIGGVTGIDELAAFGAILGFGGFVLSMLVAFLFLEKAPRFSNNVSFRTDQMPQNLGGNVGGHNMLPSQRTIPVDGYVPPVKPGNWHTTNDLTMPGSVTEQTTKLLEKEEK